MLADLFPASFWPLALAHGLALLSPGPDFMLIVSHSARHRFTGGLGICFGIAFGNACYIVLAIAGWAGMHGNSSLQGILEAAGAFYLAWLGYRLLKSAALPAPVPTGMVPRVPLWRQFGMGLGSAILNPKNMVFYLTIMTVLVENSALLRQRIAAGVWMVSVVLVWDLCLALVVTNPHSQRILWRKIPWIERICGAFLLATAISILWTA
ncbi:MAG: LysE family translocator [Planctomycetaceae bacterium]|nr:LysE family translocator [Planctomycetaceae bacterium]